MLVIAKNRRPSQKVELLGVAETLLFPLDIYRRSTAKLSSEFDHRSRQEKQRVVRVYYSLRSRSILIRQSSGPQVVHRPRLETSHRATPHEASETRAFAFGLSDRLQGLLKRNQALGTSAPLSRIGLCAHNQCQPTTRGSDLLRM